MPLTPDQYGELCEHLQLEMARMWERSKVNTTFEELEMVGGGQWVFRFRAPYQDVTLLVREEAFGGPPCDAYEAWRKLDSSGWHEEIDKTALQGGTLELTASGLHPVMD